MTLFPRSNYTLGAMNKNNYFRLELDDYAMPAFTSFGKYYFGTQEEISAFIRAVEQREETRGKPPSQLVSGFHAYIAGDRTAKHNVAYRDVPLLTPATLLQEETITQTALQWTHFNIWQWPIEMRCSQVQSKHLWIECEGDYYRSLTAIFTNLQWEGAAGEWHNADGGFWGYPEMLLVEPPVTASRLAVPEKVFNSVEELESDWQSFVSKADPDYAQFCNEIFGDG